MANPLEYLVGTQMVVKLDTVQYRMSVVDIEAEAKEVDQSNSADDAGYEITLPGQKKMMIDLEGPFNLVNPPIAVGTIVTLSYQPVNTVTALEVDCSVLKWKHSNKVEAGPRHSLSLKALGSFTPHLFVE